MLAWPTSRMRPRPRRSRSPGCVKCDIPVPGMFSTTISTPSSSCQASSVSNERSSAATTAGSRGLILGAPVGVDHVEERPDLGARLQVPAVLGERLEPDRVVDVPDAGVAERPVHRVGEAGLLRLGAVALAEQRVQAERADLRGGGEVGDGLERRREHELGVGAGRDADVGGALHGAQVCQKRAPFRAPASRHMLTKTAVRGGDSDHGQVVASSCRQRVRTGLSGVPDRAGRGAARAGDAWGVREPFVDVELPGRHEPGSHARSGGGRPTAPSTRSGPPRATARTTPTCSPSSSPPARRLPGRARGTTALRGAYPWAAATDRASELVIAGMTATASAGDDWAILKYSRSGKLLWAQTLGGLYPSSTTPNDVVCDRAGNVLRGRQSARRERQPRLHGREVPRVRRQAAVEAGRGPASTPSGTMTRAMDAVDLDAAGNVYATGISFDATRTRPPVPDDEAHASGRRGLAPRHRLRRVLTGMGTTSRSRGRDVYVEHVRQPGRRHRSTPARQVHDRGPPVVAQDAGDQGHRAGSIRTT